MINNGKRLLGDFCHTIMKLHEIIHLPRHLPWALAMEGKETTQMLRTFARLWQTASTVP